MDLAVPFCFALRSPHGLVWSQAAQTKEQDRVGDAVQECQLRAEYQSFGLML